MKSIKKNSSFLMVALLLCGCVSHQPQLSSSPPAPVAPVAARAQALVVIIPPPAPIEINGPELPCTNCYVVLQESQDLVTWRNHDEIYFVDLASTNHYADAGLTNMLGFFRWEQVTWNGATWVP